MHTAHTLAALAACFSVVALPSLAQDSSAPGRQEAALREVQDQLDVALELLAERGMPREAFLQAYGERQRARERAQQRRAFEEDLLELELPANATLEQLLHQLRRASGLSFVPGRDVDTSLGVREHAGPRRATCRDLLTSLLPQELTCTQHGSVVVVSRRDRPPFAVPQVNPALLEQAFGGRAFEVDLGPGLVLLEAGSYLAAVTGLEVRVAPEVERRRVKVKFGHVPLPLAVSLMVENAGARWTLEPGVGGGRPVLVISAP